MPAPDFDADGQDQAEVYDETHLDDEGDGDLSFDEADDVLDVTQLDGDADPEPFDEDDADLDGDLALDGMEAEADALLGVERRRGRVGLCRLDAQSARRPGQRRPLGGQASLRRRHRGPGLRP